MKIILIPIAFIGFFLVQFQNCSSECSNKPGADEYRQIVESISPSNTVAVKRFSAFPVDKQITIFLYARGCTGDPRIRPYLILDGEKKIPAIVERIKTEEKLWDKEELVSVLIPINTQCRCITKNSDVIKMLEDIGRELDENKTIPANYTYKQIYHDSVKALKEQLEEK
ncbi:MAG: hypothetical protein HOP17_16070 [Acidobacteria bacterium]|nr:hypothetical protein [Acidobacteriota bacterium]